jgi:hypothetical protein
VEAKRVLKDDFIILKDEMKRHDRRTTDCVTNMMLLKQLEPVVGAGSNLGVGPFRPRRLELLNVKMPPSGEFRFGCFYSLACRYFGHSAFCVTDNSMLFLHVLGSCESLSEVSE